ncbi:MAG: flagellar basal body rod protein FlgC [Oscillospiraceae bacterium]|nr:flagellar basal body rod protein FlgC [Oscillospiraceae bacterium]MCL2278271.1 flagellar basal body rod protein FlgC [Oscillospiraceae bacterium]
MSFLSSMNISASALTATRLRMDVIAENIANSSTTRTETGDPYRRRFVVFQERNSDREFASFFHRARRPTGGGGVRVVHIGEDMSDFKYDFNPTHPDADEHGMVRLPNVEVVQEMVDMMSAFRAYEANITALNVFKDMATRTLEIGR